ncbi:hypothetical protein QKU48_gp0330 [Fadolivirus algeromassiliense]|uniref:Uncharacterized protein n=1 Tax=Fadolivirus FV1/VV64 TaxID=3070911 RepID=A0A7D3UP84_9VIRU|nr:hypothetical protein QKU48_gp0330 [Fadolivirus algeromassiliense]QKF93788.1 hypothetical protein Fadolivirus_1_330 [Fadolivirus FV1/VV64]
MATSNKPKFTVIQVIKKSFIAWGIKNESKLRIYYKWELENRKHNIKIPCIVIDYNVDKREWYINYFENDSIHSCTIDDITGMYSILI